MPNKELSFAFGLKPEEAIKFLNDKGYRTSWDWQDTWQEAHAKSFTVAHCMKMDVLQDIKESLNKALNEGTTFEQFKKDLIPTLKAKGWWGTQVNVDSKGNANVRELGSPRRLNTIFQTNMQSAYQTGRYKSLMENTDNAPYWKYSSILDGKTRPAHRALNGKIFRFDDPFWSSHYPPNGFNCRCTVYSVDKLEADNIQVESSEGNLQTGYSLISKKTGEMAEVTTYKGKDQYGNEFKVAPDAGWNYNVGKSAYQPDLEKYDYNIAKQYVEGVVTGPPFEQFYKKAGEKAKLSLEAVYKEGIKKGIQEEKAVKYLYDNIPKEDKNIFHYAAVLDSEKKQILGAEKQAVKFSLENFAKNIIKHPEMTLAEYELLPKFVDETQLLIYMNKESKEKIICFTKDKKFYEIVIKSTLDKKENYLQSFHITDLKRINTEKNKKGVKIIYDKLTQNKTD